jgi:alginate O-acetyltransferase complex protein AlgI
MLFNSPEFLVFLIVVFSLYWLVLKKHHRMQSLLLLVSSCIFYMFFIPKYIFILFITILIDYFAGMKIATSEGRKRKVYLVVSIISTCMVLFVFKYYDFFVSNINSISSIVGWNYSVDAMKIILPIGLSFHTFQSLSYVIEVYRRKQEPEKDFLIYSLYVMYFPQLVAGPIERASNLLHQFHEKKKFNFSLAAEGMHQILWGMFKKVVIADTCAAYANHAFASHDTLSGMSLILGAIAFAFQIYGDFSGYSDIALGTSKLFGVRLMRNFNLPYFATNISDFWRRWHISLSTWFRDYVYFPLGGSRVEGWKLYRNVFTIFVLSGIWHGANWTFVMWGLIHSIFYSAYVMIYKPHKKSKSEQSNPPSFVSNFTGGILTFFIVTLAWIFFRAANVSEAFAYISDIATQPLFASDTKAFLKLAILIIPFLLLEWFNRKSTEGVIFSSYNIKPSVRLAIELVLAVLIIDCFYTLDHEQFIYFQF